MLALGFAAQYPGKVGHIVMVGCGTFDQASRNICVKTRNERIANFPAESPQDPTDQNLSELDRLMRWYEITDHYAPMPPSVLDRTAPFDLKAFRETWEDMLQCQSLGIYPNAFSAITSPVLMLHGAYDPHPGGMIRDTLKRYLPQLVYREFDRCGHDPEIEKYAKERFFKVLREWLTTKIR